MGKGRRKEKDVATPCQEEAKLYLEPAVLELTLSEDKIRDVIDLPAGLDYNEWIASHTLALFDHINLIYGTISEFCTMSGCPDMSGPSSRQYLWFDEKGKKCRVAAPQYIDCVMTFTQKTVNDENIFPTKFDKEFPSSFESIVKKIQRLLFHVLAHIYQAHFREIVLLNLHTHLNSIFCHFWLFNDHFKMVEEKETEILQDLAVVLKLLNNQNEDEKLSNTEDNRTEDVQMVSSCGDNEICMNGAEKAECTSADARPPSPMSCSAALDSKINSREHSNMCAMDSEATFATCSSHQ